jgi:uncharacterized membrane-anchored protein YhcB (DUF1043 family)
MHWLTMIALASVLLLLVGAFIGQSLAERSLEMRSRRQAAVQRQLNEQAQQLRLAASIARTAAVTHPGRRHHRL